MVHRLPRKCAIVKDLHANWWLFISTTMAMGTRIIMLLVGVALSASAVVKMRDCSWMMSQKAMIEPLYSRYV